MKFSVLDLAPVPEGSDAVQAMRNTTDLAQKAEGMGYHRYWMAEHHNMAGIASAATSVLIGHVANNTKTIRVGAGGIMLPNHAPLQIAEQFGTLATLYGDRIDLGLGRAPGGDGAVYMALRRTGSDDFPADVAELMGYLGDPQLDAAGGLHLSPRFQALKTVGTTVFHVGSQRLCRGHGRGRRLFAYIDAAGICTDAHLQAGQVTTTC